MAAPRIIIVGGEPAGIGPDILLQAAATALPHGIVAIGDRAVLESRAELLGLAVEVTDYSDHSDTGADSQLARHRPGILPLLHQPCKNKVAVGAPHARTAEYVVNCIETAADLCLAKQFDAMTTCPVNKAVLNQAGLAFRGHTEWIAARCQAPTPVMMLANRSLRVCLLSNHVPLTEVAAQVTAPRLRQIIPVILHGLRDLFHINNPRLGVCGLNPHAGEGGYLGTEEVEIIAPTVAALRAQGVNVVGPMPADTAFTRQNSAAFDALLAMYHDQGLPVIKHAGFGETVNITLGLPIIRTSVDHGTAAELAGTRQADPASLIAAIKLAGELAANKKSLC